MLVLVVAIAVFVAWSWLSYPAIGHWLYDLSMALEAKLYRLHKIVVPISEMTVSTWQGGPYEATSGILMLHGYSADKNLWLRFARHFVGDYRVIIPTSPAMVKPASRPVAATTSPCRPSG